MNDLYIHQLETENKQLRQSLKDTQDTYQDILYEKQQRIDKAIEYIGNVLCNSKAQVRNDISGKEIDNLIEILEDKENEDKRNII